MGIAFPHMSKSYTLKNKVVCITHSRGTHVTTALKAGDPPGGCQWKGNELQDKTEKCSNLAEMGETGNANENLSLSWASKPPYVSTQLGILRSQSRREVQSINGDGIGRFEDSLNRINIHGVGPSTIHNIWVA
jgi:hypothetical protein